MAPHSCIRCTTTQCRFSPRRPAGCRRLEVCCSCLHGTQRRFRVHTCTTGDAHPVWSLLTHPTSKIGLARGQGSTNEERWLAMYCKWGMQRSAFPVTITPGLKDALQRIVSRSRYLKDVREKLGESIPFPSSRRTKRPIRAFEWVVVV